MGTRSLVSGVQSKSTSDRRIAFGQLDVKKEFRIKKETPDDEIKEYAETAMNELLGWYGYDKVDSRDTQGLNLHHFAANKSASAGRLPSDADSSDAEGPRPGSPPRSVPPRGSPAPTEQGAGAGGCIVCSWCNKVVSHKMFSLKTPGGEKSFCSEMCFSQCRRANFKRNKTCDWCRHIRHTVNYVDFQDGEHQLQFCSDKCLNQYKMNIFCKETEAHLQLHPHLQGLGSSAGGGNGSASVRLITPELWLRDCRSESPFSDRSASPAENNSSPIEIKVVMRPPNDTPQVPLKPPPPSLEITKIDKRDKSRKGSLLGKNKRNRCFLGGGERRGSSSSPRSGDSLTPPKPVFPPPLLPINASQIPQINPHGNLPPDPALLRPPFLPLPCFPPSPIIPPNHPMHRNPYEQVLRAPLISPPSPTASINPPRPPLPPPPRSLLPPVTILVPYPIALAIPIPLPIPIPIPLLPPKKTAPDESPPKPTPEETPEPPPPPPAPQETPVPRPLRKRKRDLPQEDEGIAKRKTVPV